MSGPAYYRPFTEEPDVEPNSDSESTNSSLSGFSDSSARKLDDPRYAIIRAAGPPLNTVSEQLFYQSLQPRHQIAIGYAYNDGSMYDPSRNIPLAVPLFPFTPPNQTTYSSLFSFSSKDRDTNVYPLSTFFTIKTPRPYKNITQIQFVQINFPYFLNSIPDASSVAQDIAAYVASNTGLNYSNCYACIGNAGGGRGTTTSVNGGSFTEAGRTNPVAKSKPLVHTFTVRGGLYDANSLAAEADKQMNTTPPFNIISYANHRQLFQALGTADHLFNDPGRWYYSPSTGIFVRNASKSLIISDYLPNVTLTGVQPTERELFVAYFYPVLRAALYSTYDSKFLNFGTYSSEEVQQRVSAYEGLASPLYYELCYNNLAILKSIRQMHTFEYNPINAYNYTYSPADSKMIVSHTDLHPSIQKDIQDFQESSKVQAATDVNLTSRDLMSLSTKVQNTAAILSDLSKQMQMALVELGIPYNTYTNEALADPSTPLLLQSKKALMPDQTIENDDALIALTLGLQTPVSPPVAINRTFPASCGWSTLQQLVLDASNAQVASAGTRAYTQPYLQQLRSLNQTSVLLRAGSFANRSLQGIAVNCQDFRSLYSTFLTYYSTNTGLATTAATIQSNTLASTSNYVNAKYGTVFPPSLLENNAYLNGKGTGSVTFYGSKSIHYASTPDDSDIRDLRATTDTSSCCAYINSAISSFYSCLPAEYIVNTPFYKLGLGKGDDILSIYSTNGLAATTSANNIYVQLNTEQPLNNMDTAGKENFNITNEPMGEYKKVFGKLLTQGSSAGQVTQTIVQVPAKFPVAPLASLDHFSFNFYLDTMVPLNRLYPFVIPGMDWNAIIQIDEQVGTFSK